MEPARCRGPAWSRVASSCACGGGRAAPRALDLVGLPAPGRKPAELLIASAQGLHWLDAETGTLSRAGIPGIGSRPLGQAYWARSTPDGDAVLALVEADEHRARIVQWNLATDRQRLLPRDDQASSDMAWPDPRSPPYVAGGSTLY